jgi:hypothetical protein
MPFHEELAQMLSRMNPEQVRSIVSMMNEGRISASDELMRVGGEINESVNPEGMNPMERMAALPGRALGNTLEGVGMAMRPEEIIDMVGGMPKQLQDPRVRESMGQQIHQFGERCIGSGGMALMEEMDLTDLLPGLAAVPPMRVGKKILDFPTSRVKNLDTPKVRTDDKLAEYIQKDKEAIYGKGIKVDDTVGRILEMNDNLGFNSKGQAARAILDSDDWQDRWMIDDPTMVKMIETWKAKVKAGQ